MRFVHVYLKGGPCILSSATQAWKGKWQCRFLVQSLILLMRRAERCDGLGTCMIVFSHCYSIGGELNGSYRCPGVQAYCVQMYMCMCAAFDGLLLE